MMSSQLGGLWLASGLARGYMPAQKHSEVFYPLVGDVLGYAIRYAPIPRSGTVSWVLCSGENKRTIGRPKVN